MLNKVCVLFLCLLMQHRESAKILAVFPTPSISHQIFFRPLMMQLAKRGHEVTYITTNPAFPKNYSPSNIIEIDVHNVSHKLWQEYTMTADGNEKILKHQTKKFTKAMLTIFERQFRSIEVQNLINDKSKTFDLLFLEHFVRPALSYSYLYNVPVISLNSFGAMYNTFDSIDAMSHPLIYPIAPQQRFFNLSIWERLYQFYIYYTVKNVYDIYEDEENKKLKQIFGPDIPAMSELRNNIHMTFLNTYHIWDSNRPVSPQFVYIGGINENPVHDLPKDLETYLNKSTRGVIYMSFGSNLITSLMPREKIKLFTHVFSELPYNVLLKWDSDLPECSSNVKIEKWFPQPDLLKHKNIKLFITHGGHQSMSEAVDAGVPLIGIPMSGDQWFNAELFLKFGIGVKLDFSTLTEDKLTGAIDTVIRNESYHKNIIKLRDLIHDQPQSPLERAVWWTEYVLRHGGATHLRSAAAHMHWTEYYELKLILILFFIVFISILLVVCIIKFILGKRTSDKIKDD